jgi:hypothetical protein
MVKILSCLILKREIFMLGSKSLDTTTEAHIVEVEQFLGDCASQETI